MQQPCSERRRGPPRHPQAQLSESAKETAPPHPSVRMLLGSTDRESLDLVEQVTGGSMHWPPVNSPASDRKSAWWSWDRSWAEAWLEWVSGRDRHQLDPLPAARNAPMAPYHCGLSPPQLDCGDRSNQVTKRGHTNEVVLIQGLTPLNQM